MKKIVSVLLSMMLITVIANAQKSAVFVKNGIAIGGYDPVSYFQEHRAVKGAASNSYNYNDATWQFSTREHLDSFKATPEKYIPQYGGYCAYGLADGHKAPTEPEAWTVTNGKLYLNYNKAVQVLWNKNQKEFIQTADRNWPGLKNKE